MTIEFRGVGFPPLSDVTVSAPRGAVIGIIGEKRSGKGALLRLAAGLEEPTAGKILFEGTRRFLSACDSLDLSPVDLLLIEHPLVREDALARAQALLAMERARDGRTTVLLVSHDMDLVRRLCDEVWWIEAGTLAGRGHPDEVVDAYCQSVSNKFRAWGDGVSSQLSGVLRRGDGRAQILSIVTLGETERPTAIWRSGEPVAVRVRVRFRETVEEPVIGMMIRTRIGWEVYGTNTELERVKTGRALAGGEMEAWFRFRCDLCPGEYTLTAASHDADGTAHDWIDYAVAFVVTDARFTAGVANLRASVELERRDPREPISSS